MIPIMGDPTVFRWMDGTDVLHYSHHGVTSRWFNHFNCCLYIHISRCICQYIAIFSLNKSTPISHHIGKHRYQFVSAGTYLHWPIVWSMALPLLALLFIHATPGNSHLPINQSEPPWIQEKLQIHTVLTDGREGAPGEYFSMHPQGLM